MCEPPLRMVPTRRVRNFVCGHLQEDNERDSRGFFIEHGCVLDNASQAFVRPLCVHRTTSASTFILMHVACGARADGCMQRWCYLVTSSGSGRDCCRLDLGTVSFDRRALLHDFALELAARGDGAILVRERIGRLLLRRF